MNIYKTSVVTTKNSGIIVGTHRENEHDSKTLS